MEPPPPLSFVAAALSTTPVATIPGQKPPVPRKTLPILSKSASAPSSSVSSSMVSQAPKKVDTLVVDAGALIKMTDLFPLATHFYTTADVLNEIRDKKSRAFLERLTVTLEVKTPSDTAMKAVLAFTKASGDFSFLSLADLRVLALTYQLDMEAHGGDVSHLRLTPTPLTSENIGAVDPASQFCRYDAMPSGCGHGNFCRYKHQDPALKAAALEPSQGEEDPTDLEADSVETDQEDDDAALVQGVTHLSISSKDVSQPEGEAEPAVLHSATSSRILSGNSMAMHSSDASSVGWIGMDNMAEFMTSPFGSQVTTRDPTDTCAVATEVNENATHHASSSSPASTAGSVGCLTTDYTMQNVLLQMNLHLLSVQGMEIRQAKQWILRCQACFTKVMALDRQFCPKCGNATLERISCRVNADTGTFSLNVPRHAAQRPTRRRGSIYSIPKPKHGRQKQTLVLREDQLLMGQVQQTRRQVKKKEAMFGELADFSTSFSTKPTAMGCAVQIGMGRRNPNAQKGRERRGKKKK